MSTKRLALTAMLTAVALVIFVIEAQIPPVAPIPGIKLGLANAVTLFTMLTLGKREALFVTTLRIVLGSVFTGSMMSLTYSAAGGAVCFILMAVVSPFFRENSIWIISMIGAMGHNIGQIAAAVIITGTKQIIWYLPILMISAVITGIFTGLAVQYLFKRGKSVIKKLTDEVK